MNIALNQNADECYLFNKANKAFWYTKYTKCIEATNMKHHIGLTIDTKLLKEIEELRGREKRSTFIEHLIRLGLKTYKIENQNSSIENRKGPYFNNGVSRIG
jgi:hypothetical protein